MTALVFSPHGQILVAGTNTGVVLFWNIPDDSLASAAHGQRAIIDLAISPDAHRLVSTTSGWGAEPEVRVWKLTERDGYPDQTIQLTLSADSAAFAPDGQSVLFGTGRHVNEWRVGPDLFK